MNNVYENLWLTQHYTLQQLHHQNIDFMIQSYYVYDELLLTNQPQSTTKKCTFSQELPTEEIREATDGKIPNFGNSTEAEEEMVVLRRTSLFHDSTFEAMFTLLYRFFVLQVILLM